MEVAGRRIAGTTILAILAGVAGLIATAVFGWEFGEGLDNPVVIGLVALLAVLAVWISYQRG